MDLRTGFDFTLEEGRARARKRRQSERPTLLVGSPPRLAFSVIQRLNPDSLEWRRKLAEGLAHLEFVCELYKEQIQDGLFFLHEHPAHAASWGLWMVQEVATMEGVHAAIGDQCCYGSWSTDQKGPALIQKPTQWRTNSVAIVRGQPAVYEPSWWS